MNLGSQHLHLTRVVCILAVTSLLAACAAAQQAAAQPDNGLENADQGVVTGALMLSDQLPFYSPLTEPLPLSRPLLSESHLPDLLLEKPPLDRPALQPLPPDALPLDTLLGPDLLKPDPTSDHPHDSHPQVPTLQAPVRHCRHCGAPKTNRFVPMGNRYPVCEACGYDVQGNTGLGPDLAFRSGWWGVAADGSRVKVGEFQDLKSSQFWDLDGIATNRWRTLDFTLSGLDNEANDAYAYLYTPRLAVKLEYQRFLRRLDHLPLSGFDISSGAPGPTDKVVSDDLNVGEDYAIRVQQLDASVKGRLTKNLKWKINLWGMRKSGERQASAMAHCFNVNPPPGTADYTCHVLSQRQKIDWTTMEITPVLSANVGNSVVEYSRTMRAFGQNDQVVERTYTAFDYSPTFGTPGPPFVYAWVPETYTQIDRLKLNAPLTDVNQLYAHLYLGDTENKSRGTHRSFNGVDLRLTNRAFDDVTLTTYTKLDTQRGGVPSELLTTPPFGVDSGSPETFEPGSLRHPIEYDRGRVGLKGRWQSPAQNWLSVAGGYEFSYLGRKFVDYSTLSGPFTQEDTQTHQINIGPHMRVTPKLDTYVRYKGGFINDPLIGVRAADGKFNTNQPEHLHRIEIGGTWSPASNFIATALFGIENSWNDSSFANFDEDQYPILFTLWYAPTTRLSLTTGYAFLSNWIDQDITIGFKDNPTETTQWNYDGYYNMVSCTANYAYSPRTKLFSGVEWNRGNNVFSVPPSTTGADWSVLPSFSDVIVETSRVNLGIDHHFLQSMTAYLRYVHFDYEDVSAASNSGTADMILAGLTLLR